MYKGRSNNGRGNFAPRPKRHEHNINEFIRARRVRIIGEEVETKVCSIEEAIQIAADKGLDLVEISTAGEIPVCKVVEYTKFLYDRKKKKKEADSKAKQTEVKEIRFTSNTDEHDVNFKAKHAEKFLSQGNKVKCTLLFKGRNITFKERGELLLLKFAEVLAEVGIPESMPKMEGKKMNMIITPKKK